MEITRPWETVYTVHDYFDGPRNGIADYGGIAHAYKCAWDADLDDWSEGFLLSPISDEQLATVKEEWSDWRRYQAKQRAGELRSCDEHPALAEDRRRHDQLRQAVEDALRVTESIAVRAIPDFRGTIEPEYDFEVRWRAVA
jgi:hypothetical protein